MITQRSKFTLQVLDKKGSCSGCSRVFKAGDKAWVKAFVGRKSKANMGRNILCNLEKCWEEWDWKIYGKD